MRRSIRIGAALTLLAAIVAMALVGWVYRRDRARWQNLYTRSIKRRDISDTARKSMTALQDAELRAQYYVLTGETAYLEAYKADLQEWQDEFGTLEVVAQHDSATQLVAEISEKAMKVTDELAALVDLTDKGSRDAALERIRKGAAIVYLEQARDLVVNIQQDDGLAADENDQLLIKYVLQAQRRVAAAAAALFGLVFVGVILLVLEIRGRRADGDPSRPRTVGAAARASQ